MRKLWGGEEVKKSGMKFFDYDGAKPVSYTHLRAHETPEHLVCRLLLEKKKNKEPKTDITHTTEHHTAKELQSKSSTALHTHIT